MPFNAGDSQNTHRVAKADAKAVRRPLQDRTGEVNPEFDFNRSADLIVRFFNWASRGLTQKILPKPVDVLSLCKNPVIRYPDRGTLYSGLGLAGLHEHIDHLQSQSYPQHAIGEDTHPTHFPQWGVREDYVMQRRLQRETCLEVGNQDYLISLIFVPEGKPCTDKEGPFHLDRIAITSREDHLPFKAEKHMEPLVSDTMNLARDVVMLINADEVAEADATLREKTAAIIAQIHARTPRLIPAENNPAAAQRKDSLKP